MIQGLVCQALRIEGFWFFIVLALRVQAFVGFLVFWFLSVWCRVKVLSVYYVCFRVYGFIVVVFCVHVLRLIVFVLDLAFRVQGFGLGFLFQGFVFNVLGFQGLSFYGQGLWPRVRGCGKVFTAFWVQSFRIQTLGFWF